MPTSMESINALVYEILLDPKNKLSKSKFMQTVYALVGRRKKKILDLRDAVDAKLKNIPQSESGKRYNALLHLREHLQALCTPQN